MSLLKTSDFYYGAFLSALINGGVRPSLFDDAPNRRIYRLTTNNSKQEYLIVAKYVRPVQRKKTAGSHWNFNFSRDEFDALVTYHSLGKDVRLALICVSEDFRGGEVALLDYATTMDCLGSNEAIKSRRINIKSSPGQHGLRAYGSGRADKVSGKDNTILIARDNLQKL
jgi:hypothetical protein